MMGTIQLCISLFFLGIYSGKENIVRDRLFLHQHICCICEAMVYSNIFHLFYLLAILAHSPFCLIRIHALLLGDLRNIQKSK